MKIKNKSAAGFIEAVREPNPHQSNAQKHL